MFSSGKYTHRVWPVKVVTISSWYSFLQISLTARVMSSFENEGATEELQADKKKIKNSSLTPVFAKLLKDGFDFVIIKLVFGHQFFGQAVHERLFFFKQFGYFVQAAV